MANPIQAGSLASVIDLADNPPDQPLHGLTGDSQQPLVLYIVKVPGSYGIRLSLPNANKKKLMDVLDVFLTPLKPQQKVVTAQDVQSSLYYMHVDRPEDYDLLSFVDDSDDLSSEEDGRGKLAAPIITGAVPRKPLPPSPMLGLGDRLEHPPEFNPYFQNYSNVTTASPQAERKPFGQDRMVDVTPPLPDRKLLGPRSMNHSLGYPPLQAVPEKQNIDLRRWSGQPPKLPPRPISEGKDGVPMTPPRPIATSSTDSFVANDRHSSFLHRKPVAHSASHDVNRETKDGSNGKDLQDSSLSLIRRYNNEQWTVGKISSNRRKSTVGEFDESSPGISIQITTHGYLRFIDPIDRLAKQNGTCNNITPATAAEEQICFQRDLQISGNATRSTDSTFIKQRTRPSFDFPRHSHQSSGSIESNRSSKNGFPELRSGSKKGYIFKSPWDSTCEFTTGVAGRSFKCKHSYASSNPRFGPGMHSAQVSELRFNLPSSKALGSPASKSLVAGAPREAKRSSMFLYQHRRRSSSSFEARDTHGTGYLAPKVELEERLDLSLGQEHAGGGFGGKQAKLGKLIIENEGFCMLDLIVAANMALWWRVYERFT